MTVHRPFLRAARDTVSAVGLGLVGVAILAAGLRVTAAGGSVAAEALIGGEPRSLSAASSANFPDCRFAAGGKVDGYDVAALNVGWTIDWSAHITPARPGGAEYVQMVRLQPSLIGGYTFTPTTSTLHAIADANPGSIWLVGNEPDSPVQDKLEPEDYARAYYQVYYLIKQRDPSARVGAGGVVQPTPLRFEYLDRVLSAYRQYYGNSLPADLWNVHSYILREIDYTDPQACLPGQTCSEPPYEVWGALIPKGLTATRGILYGKSDMFSTSMFKQRLIDFRAWMRANGYRDVPLYVTEYGELYPYPPYTPGGAYYYDENGQPITEVRAAVFMTATFDVMRTVTDSLVGYPADAHRLVQRWLWYSVADTGYGGALFDSGGQRRPLGDVFYTYTHALSPSVDLLAVRVTADPATVADAGQPQTTTLWATVSNIGNVSLTAPITVAFYAGYPPTGTLIGSPQMIAYDLDGCAATKVVSATWPDLGAGAHPMYVIAQTDEAVVEANDANNTATALFLVATHAAYLPVILNGSSGVP